MRVLILNPAYGKNFVKSARWFARSRGRVQRHPDYLCQATAILEEDGHDCLFIDGAALNLDLESTHDAIGQFQPEMVVIQATTPSIESDIEHAAVCKSANGGRRLIVLVGSHVSAEPVDTLERAGSAVDAVALGEYDYTLRELARGTSLADTKGIAYQEWGRIIENPLRDRIADLDGLPFPAWQHIDPRHYHDFGKLHPFITLISGRGCEAACTFCQLPQVMYGRKYRAMSPSRVVDEIEYDLRLFPFLREIMFEDDTFTLRRHHERLAAICDEILHRGLKIRWSANARADLTDQELLCLMRRSGCRMLVVGFEFGDQQILNNVHKGIKLERMREFAECCRQAGIRVHGCFMIGGPGETPVTAQRTIDFACQLPIDTAQFSGLCPYPGTEFYLWADENGYIVPRSWRGWVDEDGEQRAIVDLPELSISDINRIVDEGLKTFYFRPVQILRILRNSFSLADIRARWEGLRGFVNYIVGERILKRNSSMDADEDGC